MSERRSADKDAGDEMSKSSAHSADSDARRQRAEQLVRDGDMRIEIVKREINQGALAGFQSSVTDYAAALVIVALDSFDEYLATRVIASAVDQGDE